MDRKAVELARNFLQGLLDLLSEPARIEVAWEREGLYLNLAGRLRSIPEDDPRLWGDLCRLLRLHLKARLKRDVPVVVDVGGRWAAHRQALVELARRLAERAVEEHRRIRLEPMPPQDRRLVHSALSDFPGVKTYSVGKGRSRRVVIEPTG
ncbi:MAG: SpoIIIJ-associated protein [Acetothermia bacterium 64_32]|nr:MAG: SpoIIIJ-associated protein [Acetothermia bacterium 64_32]MBC7099099.1 hypothetical protein [Candidatus Bipolaricaulota bacterium]HAF70050.1 hypothetical protein [Candidatus Acetothermia bacterium]